MTQQVHTMEGPRSGHALVAEPGQPPLSRCLPCKGLCSQRFWSSYNTWVHIWDLLLGTRRPRVFPTLTQRTSLGLLGEFQEYF